MPNTITDTDTTTDVVSHARGVLRARTITSGELSTLTHSVGGYSSLVDVFAVEDGRIVNVTEQVALVLDLPTPDGGALRVGIARGGVKPFTKTDWAAQWVVSALAELLYENANAIKQQRLR